MRASTKARTPYGTVSRLRRIIPLRSRKVNVRVARPAPRWKVRVVWNAVGDALEIMVDLNQWWRMAGDMLDCELVEIGNLPLYNQDSDANPPPEFVEFRRKIAAADGILFVSPEYNRGMPGVLKNAIDVGSRPYGQSVFDKKPAAIVTASPGSIGGFGAGRRPTTARRAARPPSPSAGPRTRCCDTGA